MLLFGTHKNSSNKANDFELMRGYAKKTLSEVIYEDLKRKVLREEIKRDERLQEDKLAKEYEISRTPIRDALRRLEQENLIEKLSYGGYRIKELTMKDIEEIFGIRTVLESYAAMLATSRINEPEIKEMEAILASSREAIKKSDYDQFIELNTEFHSRLYHASKSEHLLRILGQLWDYFYKYRKVIFRTKTNLEDSYRGHRNMIRKMKAGDQRAVERLVREHVGRALVALKRELDNESRKGGGQKNESRQNT